MWACDDSGEKGGVVLPYMQPHYGNAADIHTLSEHLVTKFEMFLRKVKNIG